MKKYITIFLFMDLCLLLVYAKPKYEAAEDTYCLEQEVPFEVTIEPIDTIGLLLDAIIQVESRGNDSCIGDKFLAKPSIGCLQIRPVMVREVNRILKKEKKEKRFTLDDRWSREKSIEMFYTWKEYHHKDHDLETIARCWNGGPKGYKKKATEYYWSKVQKELKITDNGMDI